jgi:hypothetical protein
MQKHLSPEKYLGQFVSQNASFWMNLNFMNFGILVYGCYVLLQIKI